MERREWRVTGVGERIVGECELYAGLSFSRNILTLYLKPEQKLTKAALTREILSGV